MANDGITAKFPTATVALTDFGGSHPPLSAPTTLVLQTSLAAGDTSVVSTTTIPASFPAAGWITIDAEIIKYTSFAGATFTVTRAAQQTIAASHTANANIGLWFTPQEMNQIEAEVVALETQFVQGTTIVASGSQIDLSTATGGYVHISGSPTVTSLGTLPAGRVKVLVFDTAGLSLTYNATSLILQGGVNYTTAVGDVFVFVSEGAGNWRELSRRLNSAATNTVIPLLDRNTTATTVVNTTVETNLYSKTIPGNTLGVNGGLRLTLIGDRFNNSGGAATIQFRIKFGATTLFASGSLSVSPEATRHGWKIVVEILNGGATNAQQACGWLTLETTGMSAFQLNPSNNSSVAYVASAEDTTVNKSLVVTVQHGTAAATIDAVSRMALVEQF